MEITGTEYTSNTTQTDNYNELRDAEAQELAAEKVDNYKETSNTDVVAKLQQLYDLNSNNIWFHILGSLSNWILYIDIATGERNYLGCPVYE